ncbi:MAG: hypothetical protein EXS14_07380 [Planctomycetes bacterium]|nr:hypothetical protein [Planctomycetota bacterium]
MSEATTPVLRFTKTFKKYTSEYQAPVVEHVRAWAKADSTIVFHEDKSIVKVTGTQAHIVALLAELKSRFNYTPPEDLEEKKDADTPAEA